MDPLGTLTPTPLPPPRRTATATVGAGSGQRFAYHSIWSNSRAQKQQCKQEHHKSSYTPQKNCGNLNLSKKTQSTGNRAKKTCPQTRTPP